MNFILRQIKQIRSGGMPMLWSTMRAFPGWFLWWFVTSKYGSRIAYYSFVFRIAVFLRPHWAKAHALLSGTLIGLGHFDEAFVVWERALLLKPVWEDRPLWENFHPRIHFDFLFRGQTRIAQSVMQRYLDVKNDFVREHQLDKLGIRFLIGFTPYIGHMALLDYYVKMGILGQRYTARPILLVNPKLSNRCYLDYWRRYIPDMITDPVALEYLSPLAKYLEDYVVAPKDSSGKQVYELDYTKRLIQAQWEVEGRGPLLTLTDADRERGWDCLKRLGVPPDAWFVGIHAREEQTPIQKGRNADINTYRLAMESIVARGGWVIRMGDPSMKPLPSIPHVIDYALSPLRSDWMDVFLWASSRFYIATQSGPHMVPPTFGVPCVITNWASLGLRPWYGNDLCIFKTHWSEREKRYLNLAEVISSAAAWAECAGYRSSQGIRLVDNTPEEINDVVVEMMDRLEGKLKYSKEDEELQQRFDGLYIGNSGKSCTRIGRDFLRKWERLL